MSSVKKSDGVYILYKNGRSKMVSKEAWEADWLRWWKRQAKVEELNLG